MFACVVASGGLAATDAQSTMAASVSSTCSAGGAPPDDCNAWYRTSVTLQWHWSPAEGVMSTSGCDVQTLSTDTPSSGTPKTCEVEWLNGDTVSVVKRIHVDTTPPAVTDASPARGPDHDRWYNHPVAFAFHGTDASSGLQGCSTVTYGGPDSGSATVTGTCRDVAGNVASRDVPLLYDATPPTDLDAAQSRAADHDGWYNAPVEFRFTGTDSVSGLDGCSTVSYTGPEGAGVSVTGACSDRAGNTGSRSFGINYDATPPALNDVAASAGSRSAMLRWVGSPDTVSLVVVRSRAANHRVEQQLPPALESGFRDTRLKNGVEYRYGFSAVDAAGNVAHATAFVVPSAHPRLRPRPGASVSSPPLLRWTSVRNASYYNVQLYRDDMPPGTDTAQPSTGTEKLLSRWPTKPLLRLHRTWRYGGHRLRLRPGHYRWYVWAGYGARSKQRYGGQLVNGTFTVTR
ncbi:MAG: hypothetical protein ACJ76G_11665 [Solirubrobacterales bacterium]